MILPGATLGILGGGQLGQMFSLAALRLGYRVLVLDPDPHCPAAAVASHHLCADYDDPTALADLARSCAAVSTEFENVPATALELLARHLPVWPSPNAVAMVQDRILEKGFLRDLDLATAPFAAIHAEDDLHAAWRSVGGPAILKRARFGYDGKGQAGVDDGKALASAWAAMGRAPAVLEARIALRQELSVVLARGEDGMMAFYPVAENIHRNGILDLSIIPARCPEDLQQEARRMAARIATALDYVGTMAVEYFVDETGRLLVNEIAPRPHNSGHFTIDACVQSQFDQQVRALCGLPLGDTRLLSPVVMMNLLGDLWADGEPDWSALFRHPQLKLHLYGKAEGRPGRKMGHVHALAADSAQAMAVLEALRADWGWPKI